MRQPPRSTLFPNTTLFRSAPAGVGERRADVVVRVRLISLPRAAKLLERLLGERQGGDRKSTRLNSSHSQISYAVFCLKKKVTYHRDYHPSFFSLFNIFQRI